MKKVIAWLVVITALHLWLNFDWESFLNDYRPEGQRKLNVAYISVTCHIACPVTDYITEHSDAGRMFLPKMFQGFPEIKEALIANRMQAGFLVAPMAIALKAQGVPIKIVYLGHRYGSSVVVAKNGPVHSVKDLVGKTIAIPSRFSDERLMVSRALWANGLTDDDVHMVEMAPPDVASALSAGAIDAFVMAEPFPSQAELGGYGRILFFAKEYWPDYISCVLVVRQDVIDNRPEAVQLLVDGIARSGMWLDGGKPHREYAAEFVGRYYFQQPPRVLKWALTNPMERVMYTPLSPTKPDFDMIVDLMVRAKLLDKPIAFEEFVDPRFAERTAGLQSWQFEAGND
jgi:NitT/TauT family transport system substrate-binding protein